MFTEEEYTRMNKESHDLDEKFIQLPPQEIVSCLTAYSVVYHTAMAAKLFEEQRETNALLEEILFVLTEIKDGNAPSSEKIERIDIN
jgi:ABC-type Fe2+-enterobactin transport system substrate-binding protein